MPHAAMRTDARAHARARARHDAPHIYAYVPGTALRMAEEADLGTASRCSSHPVSVQPGTVTRKEKREGGRRR